MSENTFVFKPFTIYQNYNDVMKVSTDSVLLGCFANFQNAQTLLDIGCGTGLLTLMSAYKNPELKITAIDVNANACKCTIYNIQQSSFATQIQVINISLQQFVKTSPQQFDIIICNPPYFSNSLKSASASKNIYRHQEELTYSELIQSVLKLLSDNGRFYVIIPYYEQSNFLKLLSGNNLFIHSELAVFSKINKKLPYIFLYEIKKYPNEKMNKNVLYIYDQFQKYTDEYLYFTKDFYLFT